MQRHKCYKCRWNN